LDNKGYLDDDVLADSAGQIRPMDALWTISQTQAENTAGVGTLFASKHRDGKGRFTIKLSRSDDTLEWDEIAQETWKLRCSAVQDKVRDEVVMEDYAKDSTQWKANRG
jgi:hypothetical protein